MHVGKMASWLAGVAAALLPAAAWGQARSRHSWTAPKLQGLTRVGGYLRSESYGLGGLRRTDMSGGNQILRSNISARLSSGYDLGRMAGTAAGGAGEAWTFGKITAQEYATPKVDLRGLVGQGAAAQSPFELGLTVSGGLQAYLQAMGHTSQLQAEGSKPIKSFVPTEPGVFTDRMKNGDDAFRAGRYIEAKWGFDVALAISRHSAEVNLSLVHANFASGDCHRAAYHLREALKHFPELPLARMDLRDFYGNKEDFSVHRQQLIDRLEELSPGADVWLLMAYVQHFSGEQDKAITALRRGWALGQRAKGSKETVEAVESFWDSLLAAGKVTGSLGAATRPGSTAPATRPATRPAKTGKHTTRNSTPDNHKPPAS